MSDTDDALRITAFDAALGAQVQGLNLSAEQPDEATGDALRTALATHLLLVVRAQQLGPAELLAFASCFGQPAPHDFMPGLPGHAAVTSLCKEPDHLHNYGGAWHFDLSHERSPPTATLLMAKELPTSGGDTIWSNQYLAYALLPDALRARVDRLEADHGARRAFSGIGLGEASVCTRHPLAPIHPVTGRRYLYANQVAIDQLLHDETPVADGAVLLERLLAHATRAEFCYRHQWAAGDVLIWDNRAAMHKAMNDYPGQRREMHRVAVSA